MICCDCVLIWNMGLVNLDILMVGPPGKALL